MRGGGENGDCSRSLVRTVSTGCETPQCAASWMLLLYARDSSRWLLTPGPHFLSRGAQTFWHRARAYKCYGRNVFFKTRLFKDALPPVMVTIAASRVWALNTQRRLLWTSHAPIAGGWPSRGCGPGFVSCKGAGYPCLCRDLGFPLVATGGRLLPAVAGLVLRWQWGIPLKQRGLPPVTGTSLPMELPRERAGPSHGGGVPLVSFGAPPDDRMSIATLEGESDQSGDDGSVPLPPSGRSAVPNSDPEMVAMLARAAESVGLEWRPPPCPEPSRLDDWFLGVAPRWFSGPHPGAFLPGSAWWAHWNMDGTFHCQKPLQWLILPRHPWRRSGAGVYGGPAGGAIGCDAIVSKDRFYLAR